MLGACHPNRGGSASLVLESEALAKARRLRRGALHLAPRRSQRGRADFCHGLLYLERLMCHDNYTFDESHVLIRALWHARRGSGPEFR